MTHINQRRDFVGAWISANPVLMEGEVGWEVETRKSKLGDGVTAWNDLGYTMAGVDADKADVGLSEVDNTSDMDKPVSTAQAAALGTKANTSDVNTALAAKANTSDVNTALAAKADTSDVNTALAAKAPLASPTFTGDPKAPTPATADNDTSIATTAFVRALILAGTGKPFFKGVAATPGGAITANIPIAFTPTEDTHNGWTVATNGYTVPLAGLYRIVGQAKIDSTFTITGIGIFVNGAVKAWAPNGAATGFGGSQITDVIRLALNDLVQIRPQGSDVLQNDSPAENTFFIMEYVRA